MVKLFNRILVPVDFSPISVNTVERAVDLASQYQCHLHLLHVVSNKTAAGSSEDQLARLSEHIGRISKNRVSAGFSVEQGAWNPKIIDVVNKNGFDLVLLGKPGRAARKKEWFLNPDLIAAETDVPVIALPGKRRLKKFYSILIPITNFLPLRKLVYGVYIASTSSATVKLLGIEETLKQGKTGLFLERSFDLICNNPVFNVNSEMSTSHSVVEAVNDASDLVILNPGMQSSAGAGDPYVDFPVLTINPI